MFYIKCALCNKTQDLDNTDINEANKEVIQRGWFNKVINDHYTAICPDCLYKIVQKEYTSPSSIDLEKEFGLEWKKCNPTDYGMGSEYAYISIEQFYSILHRFFNMGFKITRMEELKQYLKSNLKMTWVYKNEKWYLVLKLEKEVISEVSFGEL